MPVIAAAHVGVEALEGAVGHRLGDLRGDRAALLDQLRVDPEQLRLGLVRVRDDTAGEPPRGARAPSVRRPASRPPLSDSATAIVRSPSRRKTTSSIDSPLSVYVNRPRRSSSPARSPSAASSAPAPVANVRDQLAAAEAGGDLELVQSDAVVLDLAQRLCELGLRDAEHADRHRAVRLGTRRGPPRPAPPPAPAATSPGARAAAPAGRSRPGRRRARRGRAPCPPDRAPSPPPAPSPACGCPRARPRGRSEAAARSGR